MYKFEAARDFKRDLGKRINNQDKEKFDAYLLYQKNNK